MIFVVIEVDTALQYQMTIEMPQLDFPLFVEITSAINDFSFMSVYDVQITQKGSNIGAGPGGNLNPTPQYYKSSSELEFHDRATLDFKNLTVIIYWEEFDLKFTVVNRIIIFIEGFLYPDEWGLVISEKLSRSRKTKPRRHIFYRGEYDFVHENIGLIKCVLKMSYRSNAALYLIDAGMPLGWKSIWSLNMELVFLQSYQSNTDLCQCVGKL